MIKEHIFTYEILYYYITRNVYLTMAGPLVEHGILYIQHFLVNDYISYCLCNLHNITDKHFINIVRRQKLRATVIF